MLIKLITQNSKIRKYIEDIVEDKIKEVVKEMFKPTIKPNTAFYYTGLHDLHGTIDKYINQSVTYEWGKHLSQCKQQVVSEDIVLKVIDEINKRQLK